jgi:hypothetical protein
LLLLSLAGALGCNVEPYRLRFGAVLDDAGNVIRRDGGPGGGDGGNPTTDGGPGGTTDGGGTGGCVPRPESCDVVDNDCDGKVDEDFDTSSDPANCGGCGKTCLHQGARGTCSSAQCSYECLPNHYDLNGDLAQAGSDGCEYGPCIQTGPELCNLTDDDCDSRVDEEIAGLDSDVNNCGGCFQQCNGVNVHQVTCSSGTCGYDACADTTGPGGAPDGIPDYADLDKNSTGPRIAGCEYACPRTPPLAQEECNGIDDDCDGAVDELPIAGLGQDCTPTGHPGNVGECRTGVMKCEFGVPVCQGAIWPEPRELCDPQDRDCDGDPLNGINIDSDPSHCGPSCTVCNLAHAVAGCSSGSCVVAGCLTGHEDADGNPANGCEYACTRTGSEVCDGADNDCDNHVDEGLTPPAGFTCTSAGACDGPTPVCSVCNGVASWRCDFRGDDGVETSGSCGALAFQETLCDGADNDCDGQTDESYRPQLGSACDDGKVGICRGTGTFQCDPGNTSALSCVIDTPGQAPLTGELCNGLDDDCDSQVDDGDLVDTMVLVPAGTTTVPGTGQVSVNAFWIDAYEASRPDASGSSAGTDEYAACSNPDVLPWRNVSHAEAEAACLARGKQLCTELQWQRACESESGTLYPYGNSYDSYACNGWDFDFSCSPAEDGRVYPTEYPYDCASNPSSNDCKSMWGGAAIYDMSGNVQEWTSTVVSTGPDTYRVRGGAYQTPAQGLTCRHSFLAFDDTIAFPNLGFRCCQPAN